MNFVIKTAATDLRPGDKIYVVGTKKPVEATFIDANKRVHYRQGKNTGVAIQKEFARVVTKISEVLR